MAEKRRQKAKGGAAPAGKAGTRPKRSESKSKQASSKDQPPAEETQQLVEEAAQVHETEPSAEETAPPAAEREHPVPETSILAGDAAREPTGRFRALGENATATYQHSRDATAEWIESARDRIREQPIQSVLVAAGVGVLIGLTWR